MEWHRILTEACGLGTSLASGRRQTLPFRNPIPGRTDLDHSHPNIREHGTGPCPAAGMCSDLPLEYDIKHDGLRHGKAID